MGYIYILTSPSGKIYIGQTTRPIEKRLEEHETGQSTSCRGIYGAIQKYGWENFEKEWYECPDEDLNKHEKWMVTLMITLTPDGYNLKEGGGNRGKLSEETKQKISGKLLNITKSNKHKQNISKAKIGEKHHMWRKRHCEEAIQKMSKSRLGKIPSEETKKKISEAQIGIPKSEESKQKMRESHLGKTASEETKQKMRESMKGKNSKRVYQYDLDDNFVGSLDSVAEAGRKLDRDGSCIGRCARDAPGCKTAYGFKWSYVKY
jgi:hypothetical protein